MLGVCSVHILPDIFEKIKLLDQIKIIRIHTRAPITAPKLVSKKFLNILKGNNKKRKKQIHAISVQQPIVAFG